MQVPGFEAFGDRGPLELQFTNGRLIRVFFSPSAPERVLEGVSRIPGASRVSPAVVHVTPATTVELVTFQGHTRLMAQDECLAKEESDWVRRYASARVPAPCA